MNLERRASPISEASVRPRHERLPDAARGRVQPGDGPGCRTRARPLARDRPASPERLGDRCRRVDRRRRHDPRARRWSRGEGSPHRNGHARGGLVRRPTPSATGRRPGCTRATGCSTDPSGSCSTPVCGTCTGVSWPTSTWDRELFNLTLVRRGFATNDPVPPDTRLESAFAAAEAGARVGRSRPLVRLSESVTVQSPPGAHHAERTDAATMATGAAMTPSRE